MSRHVYRMARRILAVLPDIRYVRMLRRQSIPVPELDILLFRCETWGASVGQLPHFEAMVKTANFQPLGKVILQVRIEIGGVFHIFRSYRSRLDRRRGSLRCKRVLQQRSKSDDWYRYGSHHAGPFPSGLHTKHLFGSLS